jgi:hypothetical protein
MTFGRWVLGAVTGGIAFGAVGAQAAPMPVMTAEAASSVQAVQFYYYDDPPPVYYDPPPRRSYYDPPPPPYYGPPPRRWGHRPAPPPPGPYGGFWNREAAKDYVKDYRRAQKDIHKERVRAWNRANGY